MQERRFAGIGFALLAALCYGNVPVLARLAFNSGVPAIESIALRTFVVATIMGMVTAALGLNARLVRAAFPSFIGMAAATIAVSACYLMSVQFIPVSLAALIFFTFPVVVLVISPLFEGRKPSWLTLAAAGLAFVGLAIAVGPSFDSLDGRGLLLAAGAAAGCAAQFFTGRKLSHYLQPAVFASLIHVAILPVMLGLTFLLGHGEIKAISGEGVTALGYVAMAGVSLAYLGGYFFHMSSLKEARASVVVPFFNFEPVVSTLMAVAVLGEALAANQLIGGAIVLMSLVICSIITVRSSTP